MLSVAHSHHSQHHVLSIQAPQPTSLSALSHIQLPIPRAVPSSRPHATSSHASSQPSAFSGCDTYSALAFLSMSGPQLSAAEGSSATSAAQVQAAAMHAQQQQQQQQQLKQDGSVVQALEIARESPDGASDPTISRILETAITNIWAKVMASPGEYIMTPDEFSVFNFFQHRFEGNQVAIAARRRYWDNFSA